MGNCKTTYGWYVSRFDHASSILSHVTECLLSGRCTCYGCYRCGWAHIHFTDNWSCLLFHIHILVFYFWGRAGWRAAAVRITASAAVVMVTAVLLGIVAAVRWGDIGSYIRCHWRWLLDETWKFWTDFLWDNWDTWLRCVSCRFFKQLRTNDELVKTRERFAFYLLWSVLANRK